MTSKYTKSNELIVVVGQKLTPSARLPKALERRLDVCVDYFLANPDTRILVSGKNSIHYSWRQLEPPVRECDLMKQYLVKQGVPSHSVAMESRSQDTIGNIYYSKRYVSRHPEITNITIICSSTHSERIKLLFDRIFGPAYTLTIVAGPDGSINLHNKSESRKRADITNSELFANVHDGNDADLKNQLYKNHYYRRLRNEFLTQSGE